MLRRFRRVFPAHLALGLALAATPLVASAAGAQQPLEPRRVAILTECPAEPTDALVGAALTQAAARGITIDTTHVEYRTRTCAERAEFVERALTDPGSADGAVIVTRKRGSDGLTLFRDGLRVVRLAGLGRVVVLASERTDTDAVRKQLEAAGFDGDSTPIIRGSLARVAACDPEAIRTVDAVVAAVDRWIPRRRGDVMAPLLMPVDDVAPARGRSTVATGRIETGVVNVGEDVEIVGLESRTLKSTVTGIEMFRKLLDRGEAGDSVSVLLRGIDKKDIRRGMVIAKPGSVSVATRFTAEISLFRKEEGGRHTPFHNKRAAFLVRTADVTGEIELEAGRGVAGPGGDARATVQLLVPVAMDKGLRFAIREGGRTVGAGQVVEIIE